VPVEIIGQDPSLVINSKIPAEVEVTLRAPHSIWGIIDADPKIVKAILDLSGLSSGEHTLDLQIQIDSRPVQIVSIAPHEITFMLEPLKTVTLNIDPSLSGETAVGYQVGDISLEPKEIVVAGAQSQVQKVARARVSVDLGGIRENIDQTLPVEILDENGQKVEGITVSPEQVHVSLPVSQQGGYRDVAVKVLTVGRVASGYRLTDITVFPPVVTVYASNPDLVNQLPGVLETQELDLQNAKEDITTRITLNLPDGISIVGEQTVLIQVGISPIQSSITLSSQKVEITGLGAGLNAQVLPLTVDVILSGPLPTLDTLTREAVRVTVDLTNLVPGTHQVIPKVEVLISDIIVESVLPNTIEVVIAVGPPPTSIPFTPTPMP
jgi:YbbR domain-containing protein